jgi:transcriptional regulator with XRE-family HTH domain
MFSEDFAGLFGEAVRRQRNSKGPTQEQLAEKADLASKMISLVERAVVTPRRAAHFSK